MISASHQNYLQVIHAMNLPASLYGTDYSNISQVDNHLRETVAPANGYTKFFEVFQKHASPEKIIKIRDSFQLTYYFYNAPEFSDAGKKYFCIGPLLREEMQEATIRSILNTHALPETMLRDFVSFYNHVVVYPNLSALEKLLLVITSCLFQQKITLTVLPESMLEINFQNISSSIHISDTIESMYMLENKMMDAVAIGDAEKAKQLYHIQSTLTFQSHIVVTPIGFARSRMVVLNILLRKAVEKGGVHPIYIDSLSSSFANKIETCMSETELQKSYPNMMIDAYCGLVRKQIAGRYSPLIESCLHYIQKNYSENITLSELASAHYVSRQHLCTLFKKETGTNLTKYIQDYQMHHAAELLEDFTIPIAKVAELCGHTNAAYFTKIFKKCHGVTPTAYRNQMMKTISPND